MTKQFQEGRGYSREDWDAVDSPELTEEELATARPMSRARPELHARLTDEIRKRGPVRRKEPVSMRLDIDLVEKLRASGAGWQSRVNDALREWVDVPPQAAGRRHHAMVVMKDRIEAAQGKHEGLSFRKQRVKMRTDPKTGRPALEIYAADGRRLSPAKALLREPKAAGSEAKNTR